MPHAQCQSITIERHFTASVEQVFEAWARPELRARWFAPLGVIAAADGGPLQRGNRETVMERTGTSLLFHDITYLEVVEPRRISYRVDTFRGGCHVAASLVTVVFHVTSCGTRLEIRQDMVPAGFPKAAGSTERGGLKPFVAPEERLVAARGRDAPF